MPSYTIRSVTLFAAFGLLGAVAASCAKSSSSKGTPTSGAARQGETSKGTSPGERLAKQRELDVLRAELRALEGKMSNVTPADVRVSGEFSLPVSALGKEMLWGSDLQYLSAYDMSSGEKTQLKSIVLGSRIAELSRVGDRLLVLSKDDLAHESDYPARNVLAEFQILGEDGGALSLKVRNLGIETAQLLGPGAGIGVGAEAKPFVRSLSYDESDGTLLIEYTLRDLNDSQFDVMESLMPRSNVVRGPGLEVKEPEASRENDVTNFQTLLARLGVFKETSWVRPEGDAGPTGLANLTKEEKAHVVKYDIEAGKQIEWWVTSNTPETLLPEIKAGIEGWNRYFGEFRSERPVMVFKGKLPANVRLGDPRYNVVLFDAVADSPAAYESQAADPLTGIQTHSMIYLPFAWYNISDARYLQDADDSNMAGGSGAGLTAGTVPTVGTGGNDGKRGVVSKVWSNLKARGAVRCEMPTHFREAGFLLNARVAETPDEAGRALVRSTLLHEVGHALGMAHNFKGTLTGEVSEYNENDWLYSSSTMDYNPFAMEDSLFAELSNPNRDVTKGLVQPYDRQFIDIVYNGGKGTMERRERAYPYCDDSRHDDTLDGVDPFCRQYDFFARPDQTLAVPTERIASQESYLSRKYGGFVTLKGWAIARGEEILAGLAQGDGGGKETKLEDLEAAAQGYTGDLVTAFTHFLRTGSYSYVNALARDARLLGEWKPFDGVKDGSELSYRTGLEFISRFVKDLFRDSGALRGDAYAAYASETQSQFAGRMAGLFSTGQRTEGAAISGDPKLIAGIDGLNVAHEALSAQLLARVEGDAKASLEAFLAGLRAELDSAFNAQLTAASQRVVTALGEVVVSSGYTGGDVTARPTIRGENAHALFMGLVDLVGRPTATVVARSASLGWLAVYDEMADSDAASYKVDVTSASGAVESRKATEVRTDARAALVSALSAEVAPLEAKLRKSLYLTADERTRHEFLKQAIEILQAAG